MAILLPVRVGPCALLNLPSVDHTPTLITNGIQERHRHGSLTMADMPVDVASNFMSRGGVIPNLRGIRQRVAAMFRSAFLSPPNLVRWTGWVD
ncbi:uncharacterized protein N7515_005346 [Penicillium bovifimosum]|uniref:Uncharacterized protein n=1 Tax=Penicillium bovifimosum TaxID=126998 RepID=A0A9W9GSS7_9EURO|nr:uncharacterized protein N7515_005346 [Penicillium bovifimosum]KAJ5129307.1 hypothetical protein N7515_005346 [Penicillium bovifimosum]